MLWYHCNVHFLEFWRKLRFGHFQAWLVMTLEGSNFHQMVPNLKWNGMVSIKTYKFCFGTLLSEFIPLKPCFELWRNNINLRGKCHQLVLLGLIPKTTNNLRNYYGWKILDLKHNKITHTLNFWIINSFGYVTQFTELWPTFSFRLMKPKLTQMHPNDLKLCMEDIYGYKYIVIHNI